MDAEHVVLQVDLSFQPPFANFAGESTRVVLFIKMASQGSFDREGRCAAGPSTLNNGVLSTKIVGYY